MNELVAIAIRTASAAFGVTKKAGGYAVYVGAVISILMGVKCGLEHLAAGDLVSNYQSCLELILVGSGVISPGLSKLKVGPFARPE